MLRVRTLGPFVPVESSGANLCLTEPRRNFCSCAGFSDACITELSTGTAAGVREAPRHQIAEYGAGSLSAAYGDLAATLRL